MKQQKIIINVGRQVGSGGHIIADRLSKLFNCKLYDHELLNLAAKESGFSEEFFRERDKRKGFFDTMFHLHAPLITDSSFYDNKFTEDGLFKFQSDAILKAAKEGNCIFVGRTADYVLRKFSNVVNIFISANRKDRIKRICERRNCNEDAAQKFINDKENERATYYNYYTGKKWGFSSSYDLCINSSLMGIDKTTEMLGMIIKARFALTTEDYKTGEQKEQKI